MKTYSVTLGGRDRLVDFNSFDAMELHKRFGTPIIELIKRDVLGLNEEGKLRAGFSREAQIAFLAVCLRRGGWRTVNEAQVGELIDKELKGASGVTVYHLMDAASKAAFYSGAVTGVSQDLDEAEATAREESGAIGAEAGKALEPAAVVPSEAI